ncbi:MAG: HAD-IA family hydrolase [Acidimicrobiales bacterium]
MTEIKAVIWDMGGIFHRYFTEVLLDVGAERGWPIDRIPLGPTGRVPDADYEAMAEGRIDEHDYLRRVIGRLAAEGITFDPVTDHDWDDELRPSTWDAIHRIEESPLFQAILTNDATRWMGERWWETWRRVEHFDAIIGVATLGHRKPHPAPYREVIDRTGFAAEECIFIDDMPVNCRGAEAVGMRSEWFDIARPDESIGSLLRRIGLEA